MYNAIFYKLGKEERFSITDKSINKLYNGQIKFMSETGARVEIEFNDFISIDPVTNVCGYWISNDQFLRTDFLASHSTPVLQCYYLDTYTINNIGIRLYKYVTSVGNVHYSVVLS